MKKILSIVFALALITTHAFSQEYKEVKITDFVSTTNATSTDTVTNATVKILRTPSNPGFWDVVGISATVTKISGTVAGVVRLVGSLDGSNWVRVNPTDSLNAANVTTNVKTFTITSYPYKYLGLSYTGTGTMAAKLNGYALLKRRR